MFKKIFILILVLFFSIEMIGQVTQWRGEMRDGHFKNEVNLLKEWPEEGPTQLLKLEGIGTGYSSPVFADGTIYVTGMKDSLDYLTAIDMNGNFKWQVTYGLSWSKSFPDTRSTPTIEGDRIYVLSGTGRLGCLSAADGSELWAVDVDAEYEADWHSWGVAESPLIVDNLVICSPGGKKTSVVAFDKLTGKEAWRTPSFGGQRSYVSPTLYENSGFRYILAATAVNLAALNPGTGEVVWTYNYHQAKEWDNPGLIWTNTPIWHNDEIYISKGYNFPSKMLKMNEGHTAVEEKYTNEVLDNHHHGVVLVDGHVYGSNWISNGKGNWVCMNWDSGEIKWETEWENKGSLIFADGLFYLYEERRGNVGLVRPNPEKFDLISSFRITDGTGPHWAHPFIGDGKLFLRHGDFLMVYDIKNK